MLPDTIKEAVIMKSRLPKLKMKSNSLLQVSAAGRTFFFQKWRRQDLNL